MDSHLPVVVPFFSTFSYYIVVYITFLWYVFETFFSGQYFLHFCRSSLCQSLCSFKHLVFNNRASLVSSWRVRLNIYNLNRSNDFLYPIGLGFFHSGVEIAGREYSFGSNVGVFYSRPKDIRGATFKETIDYGFYVGTREQFNAIIKNLADEFHANSYNLISKNCNCFSDAFLKKLVGKSIPGYVNRLASTGDRLLHPFGKIKAPDIMGNQSAIEYRSLEVDYADLSATHYCCCNFLITCAFFIFWIEYS